LVTVKKDREGDKTKNLWQTELVTPIKASKFFKDTADTEKMILFGESNSGKSSFYFSILSYLKNVKKMKEDDMLMCIVYPDRPTGIKKLEGLVPDEYKDNILVFPINTYEELVSATAVAEKRLDEHYKKTGVYGWLVLELLEEAWKMAQDYYTREAYGETLGEYFAQKRAEVKAMKTDDSAYKSLSGWGDWSVIKFFHNYNWIDIIKRMQFNIVFTSELKQEGNKDSIFYDLGYRPAGEKDNMHRVDTIIHLSHKGNMFKMAPYKLTGFRKLYGEIDITNKNPYVEHKKALKRLEDLGYKSTAIKEIEQNAGISPPTKKSSKVKEKPKENKEEKEKEGKGGDEIDWDIE